MEKTFKVVLRTFGKDREIATFTGEAHIAGWQAAYWADGYVQGLVDESKERIYNTPNWPETEGFVWSYEIDGNVIESIFVAVGHDANNAGRIATGADFEQEGGEE